MMRDSATTLSIHLPRPLAKFADLSAAPAEMNASPSCAVCGSDDWEVIGKRRYTSSSLTTGSQYVRKRMRVLFEIWHPGCDAVENQSLLCRRCGFVTYIPRPSADDLNRKYQFLGSLELDENVRGISPERETRRAGRLRKKLTRYLSSAKARILDFGGGDGRLVAPFAGEGCQCFVLDHVPRAVPNVTRLGATLDDLAEQERFNLIVCSHVVEHLADPLQTLIRLGNHLIDGGVVYVEVPMEIWRKAPLHEEPVTHVNFFNLGSTRTLLQRAGLQPIEVQLEDYPHPLGHHTVVVSALARRLAGASPSIDYSGYQESKRYLSPDLGTRLQRILLCPQHIPRALWARLRRQFSR
jgi:SAM-dependent methyltransferase